MFFFFIIYQYNESSIKSAGGLIKPTLLFQFDISPYVKLESEIEFSDDLVFLIRIDGHEKKYLLRRFILSGYNPDKGFFKEPDAKDVSLVPDYPIDLVDPYYQERYGVTQEYYLMNIEPSSLIAINYPIKVIPLENWQFSSFRRVYRVISKSWRSLPDEAISMEAPQMEEELYKYYTYYADDEKIHTFALQITEDSETYFEKVVAIYNYLRSNYYYSLKPGVSTESNQLHHFLFKAKKGYCSYFAFAMALLLRSIGIPSRVAVGFFIGPESEVPAFYQSEVLLNFYEVRQYQAHAWIEVYFGEYGWIELDPTSTSVAPGEIVFIPMGTGESLEITSLIQEILQNQDKLIIETDKESKLISEADQLSKSFWASLEFLISIWYIIIPTLYMLVLGAVRFFYLLLFIIIKDERIKIKYLYLFSLNLTFSLGLIRQFNQSLLEYAKEIEETKGLRLKLWTQNFLKAVFSNEFTADDYKKSLANYQLFIKTWKARIPLFLRILSLFNPVHSLRKKV